MSDQVNSLEGMTRPEQIFHVLIDWVQEHLGSCPSERRWHDIAQRRGIKISYSTFLVYVKKLERDGFIQKIDGQIVIPGSVWIPPKIVKFPDHQPVRSKYVPGSSEQSVRNLLNSRYDDIFIFLGRRDGFKCSVCDSPFNLQIDHISAVRNGGTNEVENLQLLCGHHNVLKNREYIAEFDESNSDKTEMSARLSQ